MGTVLGWLTHTPLLGLVLGPIVTILVDALKKGWTWLDNQSSIIKQASAVVLSFVLVGLVQLAPGSVPADCANVAAQGISSACQNALASGPFIQGILSALVSIAVKHGQQATTK